MNPKIYDILKYVGRIALPAVAAALLSLGEVWAIPYYEEIAQTCVIAATLINALLQVDSNKFFEENEIVPIEEAK